MATITVNGNTLNPEAPDLVSRNAKDSNFIYIQGYHDLDTEEKQQLAEMDVEIQEYVAEYTYLCHYTPEDLERTCCLLRTSPRKDVEGAMIDPRQLWLSQKYLLTARNYHAELKSTISLKDMAESEVDRTEYEVDLILHENPNKDSAALAPYVAQRAGVAVNELEVCPNKIRLTVHQDKLDDLATLDSVNRIEEVRPKGVYNDHARGILQADALFTSTGYQGASQMVCVADTGFDQGVADHDSSFKVHPAFAGRVEHLVSLWITGDSKDPVGHGTHVCGSVCGSGIYADFVQGKDICVKGTAPAAKLMVQSMSTYSDSLKRWILKAPADLSSLFSVPYNLGIRIHNNSWGDIWDEKTGQLGYEADASTIDRFIHEHQDFNVLIAAGNDADSKNHGASQIGDNGAAKNCITVGATGTTRPNDGQRYYAGGIPLSGIADTAIFSSRGPTKSTIDSQGRVTPGRIKPDVVAPGVVILSAASRSVAADAVVRTRNGSSNDNDWIFMSGTSMATPLVAGCVALIREALQEHGKQHPSAALVKALLINGAVSYASSNGPGLDGQQGFGRVDINSSIAMIKQFAFVEGGSKLEARTCDVPALRLHPVTDSRWESPAIPVPSGRHRLVVTLTYPDAPGALLQNDVNLVVRAGEVERHGNMGTDMGFDHINNVERVIWDDVLGTSVTIVVQAYAFTKQDAEQAFAVAWNIQAEIASAN